MTAGTRKRESARNEGKACDAVVRCIEQRAGETRAAIRRPEVAGVGPPVDLRLRLGAREYALEHTQIEAFKGRIRTDMAYKQLVEPVTVELSGTLPGTAVYELYFPIDTYLGVKPAEIDRIRQALIVWVRAKARCLYERNRDRLERERRSPRFLDSIEARPPGFPFAVRLRIRPALSSPQRGTLLLARVAPDEEALEVARADRLREALRRKCPKLQRCKEDDDSTRTVLMLESDDIALTNHVLVGECLVGLMAEREDLPDEIYLVETQVKDSWLVHRMKLDDECWPMEHLAEPTMFHMDDLIDLSEATTT